MSPLEAALIREAQAILRAITPRDIGPLVKSARNYRLRETTPPERFVYSR